MTISGGIKLSYYVSFDMNHILLIWSCVKEFAPNELYSLVYYS